MSVAKCLGVDDLDAPNMRELRAEWPRWRQMSSDLPDVDDLKDLPRWMQNAEPAQRDEVLTALRGVAAGDRRAYVALAWLLMPGAARVAGRIGRLADEIDEVVAGQLWVQICEHGPADDRYVAKKILDRVYRESMAELGVGDRATRRDEAWAMTVLVDAFDESIPAGPTDDEVAGRGVLADLLQRGIDSGKLAESDRDLLLDLAHAADGRAGAPRSGWADDAVGHATGGGSPWDVCPLDPSSRSRRYQGNAGGGRARAPGDVSRQPSGGRRPFKRSTASARGARRLSIVNWTISGFVAK